MNYKDIEIQRLKGELELLKLRQAEQLEFWTNEQDFWRSKYLKDHPEHDNWDYVESARESENGENWLLGEPV